jgi:peptidoglycan/LPS O-acetylase OafA/YrhL
VVAGSILACGATRRGARVLHSAMTTTSPLPYFLISTLLWLAVAAWCRRGGIAGEAAGRHVAIDGLRGFLALGVLFHHALFRFNLATTGRWEIPDSPFYTLLGQVAVMGFFMITGFLFWDRVQRDVDKSQRFGPGGAQRSAPIDWPRFYGARIRRIVPMYLVAVALLLLVVAFESGGRRQVPSGALADQVFRWLCFALLGMPDVNGVPDTKLYISGVVWTLKYEWAFYWLLPFMALFATGARFAVLAGGAVALALATDDALVLCFLGGMLAAYAVNRWALFALLRTRAASLVPMALIAAVFLGFDEGYGVAQAALLAGAFFFVAHGNDVFGLLAAPASRVLGTISYSIYLLHGLLLYAGFRAVGAVVPIAAIGAGGYWALVGALAGATVACASLTYRWIEQPFMRPPQPARAATYVPPAPRSHPVQLSL